MWSQAMAVCGRNAYNNAPDPKKGSMYVENSGGVALSSCGMSLLLEPMYGRKLILPHPPVFTYRLWTQ